MISATHRWLDDEGNVDLSIALRCIWSRRWWVAGTTVLFSALFATAALVMTPIYSATTVLISANSDRGGLGALGSALGQLGGLASLAGLDLSSGAAETEEALAVLRSREFTEGFIEDFDLMPELFADQWDEVAKRWKGRPEKWPTLAQAYRYFDENVRTITRVPQTGLVELEIRWRDPEKAALWANELVSRLNRVMRARAIDSTNAAIGFLQKELESTSTVETRSAIGRLLESQINQRMFANVTQEYAFRVADRALPPDPRDVVRPDKPLLFALGPLIGLTAGALLAMLLGRPRRVDST